MNDPTYIKAEIDANPIWKLAFEISEQVNDEAPLGWYKYTIIARWILENFERKK